MSITGSSIIGFARSAEGPKFHATNAASGEELEPAFASATPHDVDVAARLAATASGWTAHASGRDRGALLRAIAANLEACSEELIARAHLETALPLARLQGELGRTTGQLRMFAAYVEEGSWVDARIDHGDRERKPAPRPDLRSMLRPLGPVAVFGASNFPLAFSVPGGDTASALAAGCPVLVKAHPAHPGTSEIAGEAIARAVRELGWPEGTFSLLFDAGIETGVELARHPAVKAIAFTGSRRGGVALMEIASRREHPIPVYAEMGSINPVFILPEAMRTRGAAIAAALHASVTLGVGQFCTNPGVVITGTGASDFIEELEKKMSATPAAPMLTAGICNAYRGGLSRLASVPGVEQRAAVAGAGNAGGAALFRTDAQTFLREHALMDEVFGPSTVIVESSREGLLDIARALEGQLTVTIHATADEVASYGDLIEILETKAGRLLVNGFPTGVEVSNAIVHGGPVPATSDGRSTSVGTRAIERFTRAVCYQDFPDSLLPPELQESNPLKVRRMVDGRHEA